MKVSYEIIFSDDGSKDDSFQKIKSLAATDHSVRGVSLSRNFGHQIALTAGLQHALGEVIISMDADLQHPPELIPKMYESYTEGYDIVNTIRMDTKDATILKKWTSAFFYKVLNMISDVPIIEGAADFRLMNRKSLDAYLQITEKDRFMRGLVSWLGFRQSYVKYEAAPRFAGTSKYTLKKMIRLATDGITAFSSKPLRISFYIGMFISLLGMLYGVYAVTVHVQGQTVPGWTSILVSVLFLGGIQLVSIGILGEYLARVFGEVKNRPLYFIKDKVSIDDMRTP